MKKIIVLLFTVICFFSLASCNVTNQGSNTESSSGQGLLSEFLGDTSGDQSNIPKSSSEQDLLNSSPKDTSELKPSVEHIQLGFFSYGEYQKFIETADLPDNFIYYDSVKSFGKFDAWIQLSYDNSKYMYCFDDPSGDTFSLYIDTDTTDDIVVEFETLDKIDESDMRRLGFGIRGKYEANGICYKYLSGILISITWVAEGIEYTLSGDYGFRYYENDMLLMLMNLKTAPQVIASINSSVSK